MLRFERMLAIAICIGIAPALHARDHSNVWLRTTLSVPVLTKVKVDIEWQHRRQNAFMNSNMFDKKLMFTYRNWIHYQYSKNVKFSVSPFAYFSNYKIIQKQFDEQIAPNSEFRLSGAVEIQKALFQKLFIINRTAIEYRFLESIPNITRLRTRLGLDYFIEQNLKLGIYNELLLNVTGTGIEHFFDHNRTGVDLEYKISGSLKFDVGYMHITRLPVTNSGILQEHIIFFNLTVLLFNKQAKL